jgi:hypothetical protein
MAIPHGHGLAGYFEFHFAAEAAIVHVTVIAPDEPPDLPGMPGSEDASQLPE